MRNILVNHDYVQYYLDHLEHLLSTDFTPDAIAARVGIIGGVGCGRGSPSRPTCRLTSHTRGGASGVSFAQAREPVSRLAV